MVCAVHLTCMLFDNFSCQFFRLPPRDYGVVLLSEHEVTCLILACGGLVLIKWNARALVCLDLDAR